MGPRRTSSLQLFARSNGSDHNYTRTVLRLCLQLEAVRRAAAEGQVRSSSTTLADAAVSGVRQQVELRAGELRDALLQLRTRVELAEQERRAAEQQVASRCATCSSSTFSQSHQVSRSSRSLPLLLFFLLFCFSTLRDPRSALRGAHLLISSN